MNFIRSRESGQSTIETIMVLPLCIACVGVIIDAGLLVRSQMRLERVASKVGVLALASNREVSDAKIQDIKSVLLGDGEVANKIEVEQKSGAVVVSTKPSLFLLPDALAPELTANAVTGRDLQNASMHEGVRQ